MDQPRYGSRWWIASAVAVCLLVLGQIVSAQSPFRAVHVNTHQDQTSPVVHVVCP